MKTLAFSLAEMILGAAVIVGAPTAFRPSAGATVSAADPWRRRVQNQGTVLDVNNAAAVWNIWTGTSKLWVEAAGGCGNTVACVIYANDGASLYWTYCDLPEIPWPYWAGQYYIYQGYTNLPDTGDCAGLAPNIPSS